VHHLWPVRGQWGACCFLTSHSGRRGGGAWWLLATGCIWECVGMGCGPAAKGGGWWGGDRVRPGEVRTDRRAWAQQVAGLHPAALVPHRPAPVSRPGGTGRSGGSRQRHRWHSNREFISESLKQLGGGSPGAGRARARRSARAAPAAPVPPARPPPVTHRGCGPSLARSSHGAVTLAVLNRLEGCLRHARSHAMVSMGQY
jgi:hypothetical protein